MTWICLFFLEKNITNCLEITLEWAFLCASRLYTFQYWLSPLSSHRYPGISIFKYLEVNLFLPHCKASPSYRSVKHLKWAKRNILTWSFLVEVRQGGKSKRCGQVHSVFSNHFPFTPSCPAMLSYRALGARLLGSRLSPAHSTMALAFLPQPCIATDSHNWSCREHDGLFKTAALRCRMQEATIVTMILSWNSTVRQC